MLTFLVLLVIGVLLSFAFFCKMPKNSPHNSLQNATVCGLIAFCPVAGLGLLLFGYEVASHNSYLMLNAPGFLKSGSIIFVILFATVLIWVWGFFRNVTPLSLKELRAAILLATLFPVFLTFGSSHYLWPVHGQIFSKAMLPEAVPLIFIGIVLLLATFHRNFLEH